MTPCTYSVRRQGDREQMAKEVGALVLACGATFNRSEGGEYPGPRRILLEVETPGGLCVFVNFDGDSTQPDVYVLSWHMRLNFVDTLDPITFGGDVNPHHFRKATYVAYGYRDLCEKLKKGLDLAISGEGFRQFERRLLRPKLNPVT